MWLFLFWSALPRSTRRASAIPGQADTIIVDV